MTVEEFELAAEEAIETRPLRIWEVYDLRLLIKFARRQQRVSGFAEIFLHYAGRWQTDRKLATRPQNVPTQGSLLF